MSFLPRTSWVLGTLSAPSRCREAKRQHPLAELCTELPVTLRCVRAGVGPLVRMVLERGSGAAALRAARRRLPGRAAALPGAAPAGARPAGSAALAPGGGWAGRAAALGALGEAGVQTLARAAGVPTVAAWTAGPALKVVISGSATSLCAAWPLGPAFPPLLVCSGAGGGISGVVCRQVCARPEG